MDDYPPDTMFASSSVRVHLVRGAIGVALTIAAFALIGPVGPVSLLLMVPAVFAWRGCISCWALGLTQTKALERARENCAECVSR